VKITIHDVAAKAGVSASTVSRVFNKKGSISPKTTQEVLQIAKDMGYKPRSYKKAEEASDYKKIALLCSGTHIFTTNVFYSKVVHGVEQIIAENGYQLIYKVLTGSLKKDLAIVDELSEQQVCGVLFVGYDVDTKLILRTKENSMPVVLIDNDAVDSHIDSVVNDNINGARKMVSHLIELGHKNIAFIGGPLEHVSLDERYIGYKQALKLAAIEKNRDLITFCTPSFTVEDGYEAAKKLLTTKNQTPTAIFAATDLLAIGAIRAARELGKEVPGDISVVGFDDEETAEHIIPALTTVRIHKHRMGVESGRKLIQMIENASNFPTKTVLFTDLVIRDSAGPYNQK